MRKNRLRHRDKWLKTYSENLEKWKRGRKSKARVKKDLINEQRRLYFKHYREFERMFNRKEVELGGFMDDTLKGAYKELWIEYQNSEAVEVNALTYDQLIERIAKWESIEFEARAKRQKAIAEKRSRDIEREKSKRDSLITDPRYSPSDSPSKSGNGEYKVKAKGERLTKEQKLQNALGELGLDLGDLLKDVKAKKG